MHRKSIGIGSRIKRSRKGKEEDGGKEEKGKKRKVKGRMA